MALLLVGSLLSRFRNVTEIDIWLFQNFCRANVPVVRVVVDRSTTEHRQRFFHIQSRNAWSRGGNFAGAAQSSSVIVSLLGRDTKAFSESLRGRCESESPILNLVVFFADFIGIAAVNIL